MLFLPWGRTHGRGQARQRSERAGHVTSSREAVSISCQGLGLGLGGKSVLSFVEAEAQDLSIQVIILISQLVILLQRGTQATLTPPGPTARVHGLLTTPQGVSLACPGHPDDRGLWAGLQGEEGWVLRGLGS